AALPAVNPFVDIAATVRGCLFTTSSGCKVTFFPAKYSEVPFLIVFSGKKTHPFKNQAEAIIQTAQIHLQSIISTNPTAH
ncbi:MAG: hypothetical protein IKN22_01220, partial [Bacteroidaceae bacterium]|nr:hypothetical protein [Bacteroidaceae bacterium]